MSSYASLDFIEEFCFLLLMFIAYPCFTNLWQYLRLQLTTE